MIEQSEECERFLEEVKLHPNKTIPAICNRAGIAPATGFRWYREHIGPLEESKLERFLEEVNNCPDGNLASIYKRLGVPKDSAYRWYHRYIGTSNPRSRRKEPSEVCKRFLEEVKNHPKETIHSISNRLGINLRSGYTWYDKYIGNRRTWGLAEDQRIRVIEEVKNRPNENLGSICQRLGLNYDVACNWLAAYAKDLDQSSRYADVRPRFVEAIRNRPHNSGKALGDFAQEYGIIYSLALYWKRKFGLNIPVVRGPVELIEHTAREKGGTGEKDSGSCDYQKKLALQKERDRKRQTLLKERLINEREREMRGELLTTRTCSGCLSTYPLSDFQRPSNKVKDKGALTTHRTCNCCYEVKVRVKQRKELRQLKAMATRTHQPSTPQDDIQSSSGNVQKRYYSSAARVATGVFPGKFNEPTTVTTLWNSTTWKQPTFKYWKRAAAERGYHSRAPHNASSGLVPWSTHGHLHRRHVATSGIGFFFQHAKRLLLKH